MNNCLKARERQYVWIVIGFYKVWIVKTLVIITMMLYIINALPIQIKTVSGAISVELTAVHILCLAGDFKSMDKLETTLDYWIYNTVVV